jgi:hypothetical protein
VRFSLILASPGLYVAACINGTFSRNRPRVRGIRKDLGYGQVCRANEVVPGDTVGSSIKDKFGAFPGSRKALAGGWVVTMKLGKMEGK